MLVEVVRLAKVYGNGQGLKPLTVSIEPGEFVAIVGHNGAGKSTFLKLLAHWLKPDAGDVFIGGVSFKDRLAAVRHLGFVPETPNLYEQFSVEYNLRLFARLLAVDDAKVTAMVQEFDLGKFRHSRVQALSKGLKQRVSLGRSLLSDPRVLLLDEPTSGLDYEMTKEFHRRLQSLNAAGKTVLFTSHRPEEVRSIARRLLVLHDGLAVFDGPPDAYFASPSHQELFQ